jgi:hypothetical protein
MKALGVSKTNKIIKKLIKNKLTKIEIRALYELIKGNRMNCCDDIINIIKGKDIDDNVYIIRNKKGSLDVGTGKDEVGWFLYEKDIIKSIKMYKPKLEEKSSYEER